MLQEAETETAQSLRGKLSQETADWLQLYAGAHTAPLWWTPLLSSPVAAHLHGALLSDMGSGLGASALVLQLGSRLAAQLGQQLPTSSGQWRVADVRGLYMPGQSTQQGWRSVPLRGWLPDCPAALSPPPPQTTVGAEDVVAFVLLSSGSTVVCLEHSSVACLQHGEWVAVPASSLLPVATLATSSELGASVDAAEARQACAVDSSASKCQWQSTITRANDDDVTSVTTFTLLQFQLTPLRPP